MRSAGPVMRNYLGKPEDLMLQNATFLRKSAPWLPNMSDGDVSCFPPATRNSCLQILFVRPMPAMVYQTAAKPTNLAQLCKAPESIALAAKNAGWTTKSGPNVVCFSHFDFEQNVLPVTTRCTFSTSQVPQMVRTWRASHILTSKCASRHSHVQFLIRHTSEEMAPHPPL